MKGAVLIFGAGGQDGHYLAEAAVRRGYEVVASSRSSGRRGSVADAAFVSRLVKGIQPEMVFNLAATSSADDRWADDHRATIVGGARNVLDAVLWECPSARVFLAGSALQLQNHGRPLAEDDPESDDCAYAEARNEARALARLYRDQWGVLAKFGILFHHESPRRPAHFISQMIVSAARRAHRGEAVRLALRDTSIMREWTYAGDMAEAMFLLMEQEKLHEACLGSGVPRSIADWAGVCFRLVGRDWRDHITTTAAPSHGLLVANAARMKALGWRPALSMRDLAAMMLGMETPTPSAKPEEQTAGPGSGAEGGPDQPVKTSPPSPIPAQPGSGAEGAPKEPEVTPP